MALCARLFGFSHCLGGGGGGGKARDGAIRESLRYNNFSNKLLLLQNNCNNSDMCNDRFQVKYFWIGLKSVNKGIGVTGVWNSGDDMDFK